MQVAPGEIGFVLPRALEIMFALACISGQNASGSGRNCTKAACYNKGENYELCDRNKCLRWRVPWFRLHIITTFYARQVFFVSFFEKFLKTSEKHLQKRKILFTKNRKFVDFASASGANFCIFAPKSPRTECQKIKNRHSKRVFSKHTVKMRIRRFL